MAPQNPQLILSKNSDALGIVILSNYKFFNEVIKLYKPDQMSSNFVDDAVDHHMGRILNFFDSHLEGKAVNTDRAPYYHVQTIGHVSGIDEHVNANKFLESDDGDSVLKLSEYLPARNADIWGSRASQILSVNIHPRYGGWYAYRMLLVFHAVSWPMQMVPPLPRQFLTEDDKRRILVEYNRFPDLGLWRDFHDKSTGRLCRYEAHQYFFFHEQCPKKRRRSLALLQHANDSLVYNATSDF